MSTALLFDLDGTLVDTDHEHLLAFQRVFAPHGIALDRTSYNADIMGASNDVIGLKFLPHLTPEERSATLDAKEAAYREGLGALSPIAGLIELLDWADARVLPRAVVTNAPRANAELVLRALGLEARLPTLVCAPELERSKPDPLPYLTGLARTRARPENSVAFEDSLSGARAAAAAGVVVVGLTTSLEAERLMAAGAKFAVADFTDARIYQLIETRMARA